jgi:hypothetical protein
MYPTQKSPERANALQRYLILHSQRETLQEVLNNTTSSLSLTPSPPPPLPVRSRANSLTSVSGSKENCQSLAPVFASQQLHRSSSVVNAHNIRLGATVKKSSLAVIMKDNVFEAVREKEKELRHVNEEIKSTLMILLNCEGVHNRRRYRTWVETRLIDVEKRLSEFRRQSCKRRKSAVAEAMF